MSKRMKAITNTTMKLNDCRQAWHFDRAHDIWCLEDICYTPHAKTPEFQRMNIYVPAEYMKEGGVLFPNGRHGRFTAETAPVVFFNNAAGYMQMPAGRPGDDRDTSAQYLERGMVFVSCGCRGRESVDSEGILCGKSPWTLVDFKTAIRFLRHNAASLPGRMDRLISVGWSAGGAMSALLGVTGNNSLYNTYLEENGAFMDETDDVYASQIYCPIVDLEHADLAYEWQFHADKVSEGGPGGAGGKLTPFEDALSKRLSDAYIRHFNGLELKHPDSGEILQLGPDGRSGSGYEYLMQQLENSASEYFRRLAADTLTGQDQTPDDSEWLSWDGKHAHISDLDTYLLSHRRRMKHCTSFDTLNNDSGENQEFGTSEHDFMHFCTAIAPEMDALREEFPDEVTRYFDAFAAADGDSNLNQRKYLINPMNFIGTDEPDSGTVHYRIRVGACDADTAFTVSMTLALRLSEVGKNTDYALVWDRPHCEADYPGECCDWIETIV